MAKVMRKFPVSRVRATREGRARREFGFFYMHDWNRNFVVDHHINLEELEIEGVG